MFTNIIYSSIPFASKLDALHMRIELEEARSSSLEGLDAEKNALLSTIESMNARIAASDEAIRSDEEKIAHLQDVVENDRRQIKVRVAE